MATCRPRRAACRSTSSAVRLNHPGDVDLLPSISTTAASSSTLGFDRQHVRELFELPGGPLGLAVGVEYRKLNGQFRSRSGCCRRLQLRYPGAPTKGAYNVKEAYAELNAPLLANQPMAELARVRWRCAILGLFDLGLDHDLQGRRELEAVKALRLRGSYAEGFRAPQIGELFGTLSRFDQTISDPCSTRQHGAAAIIRTIRRHRRTALRTAFPRCATYQQANPQISVMVGGNEPEGGDIEELGLRRRVQPGGLPGPVDRGQSLRHRGPGRDPSFAADATVANCENLNDPISCAAVTRSQGSGQLTQVQGILQNIAGIKTKGSDLNFSYRSRRTDWGAFGSR